MYDDGAYRHTPSSWGDDGADADDRALDGGAYHTRSSWGDEYRWAYRIRPYNCRSMILNVEFH